MRSMQILWQLLAADVAIATTHIRALQCPIMEVMRAIDGFDAY